MSNSDALRIYIVEDQAVSRAMLEDLLTDHGYVIGGSAPKAEKAWVELNEKQIDLVLLDIHLAGEKDGIWLARKIRESMDLPIVFLTAFGDSNTLTEVVSTHPNGYLMKPYNLPTLLTTLNIAVENFSSSRSTTDDSRNLEQGIAVQDYIFVKDGYTMIKLMVQDIQYIQSDGNYINIFLPNRKYTIRTKLKDFYTQLPESEFAFVHLRYVVRISIITKVETDKLFVGSSNSYFENTSQRIGSVDFQLILRNLQLWLNHKLLIGSTICHIIDGDRF